MRKTLLSIGILMAAGAVLVGLLGGARDSKETAATSQPQAEVQRQVLTVRADKTGVETDKDHLATGFVTVRLQPHDGDHSMQLMRLKDGVSLDQVIEAMASDDFEQVQNVSELLGGFVAPREGQTYDLTIDLDPGNYGLVDFGGTRKPNFLKGFATSFIVDAGERHPGSAPESVATITLDDFEIDGPEILPAGTVEVRNAGATIHELNFGKLNAGKGMSDFVRYVEKEGRGQPPVEETTGVATTAPDTTVYVDLPFESGDYVAICFTADKHGPPHVALGMYAGFAVD